MVLINEQTMIRLLHSTHRTQTSSRHILGIRKNAAYLSTWDIDGLNFELEELCGPFVGENGSSPLNAIEHDKKVMPNRETNSISFQMQNLNDFKRTPQISTLAQIPRLKSPVMKSLPILFISTDSALQTDNLNSVAKRYGCLVDVDFRLCFWDSILESLLEILSTHDGQVRAIVLIQGSKERMTIPSTQVLRLANNSCPIVFVYPSSDGDLISSSPPSLTPLPPWAKCITGFPRDVGLGVALFAIQELS
jgi:hypothetical protein